MGIISCSEATATGSYLLKLNPGAFPAKSLPTLLATRLVMAGYASKPSAPFAQDPAADPNNARIYVYWPGVHCKSQQILRLLNLGFEFEALCVLNSTRYSGNLGSV
jgi:hypothetical protein